MRLVRLTVLLIALVPCIGCGFMQFKGGVVEDVSPWPIDPGVHPRLPLGEAGKPSLLVRIDAGALVEIQNEGLLDIWSTPSYSGLFSGVATQFGTDGYSVSTDYTIDVEFSNDQKVSWYTWVGVLTFGGVPVGFRDQYMIECTIRDREHKELGRIEKSDHMTMVAWMPFLPLNVAMTFVPTFGLGHALGLDLQHWDADKAALVRNLVKATIMEAHLKYRFAKPAGRQAAAR